MDDPALTHPYRQRIRELALVTGVLVACLSSTFGSSYKVWRTHLADSCDSRMFMNVLVWNAEGFRQGRSWHEIWQLPFLYPEPNVLASCDHMLGDAVLFAPLYFATHNPVLAFNLWLVLIVVLNYLSAYFVARQFLNGVVPCLLAAVLFAFGFIRLWHIMHIHLWPHFPTPILFLAAVNTGERRGWRWPALAGFCLAAQFYFSMYLGYMAVIMLGAMLAVWAFYRPNSLREGGFLGRLGLAGMIATVPLIPLAGPYRWAAARWGVWTWQDTVVWFPGWIDFFRHTPDQFEKGLFWGYVIWGLCLMAAASVVWQLYRHAVPPPYWVVVGVVLIGVLACLSVDQFHGYQLLYKVLPGFSALRCPARLTLLALWPCGLVGGWALAEILRPFQRKAPGRSAVLGLAVVGLVLAENHTRPQWSDATVPQPELYGIVVRHLPPGPIADFPIGLADGSQSGRVMSDRSASAAFAGFRPTLNIYTSKVPAWIHELGWRQARIDAPAQAASLLGELRLRGIRYVVLHKNEMAGDRVGCWLTARCRDGRKWGKLVYDDQTTAILDLEDCPREARLIQPHPGATGNAALSPGERSVSRLHTGAASEIVFTPTMPLQPGHYRATFDFGSGTACTARCEICRLASLSKPLAILAHSDSKRGDNGPVSLEFTVPSERGPEPILTFRASRSGAGELQISGVTIEPSS